MKASAQAALCVLFSLAAVPATAGPADDLLPPPVRQAEKRSLTANDVRQSFYNGRGGLGAAFSPDGKFLIASVGFQGMSLWDVGAGHALGQLPIQFNGGGGLSAVFTADGRQLVVANWGNPGMGLCPVGVWDVARREKLRSLDDDVNDTPFTAVAAAPDGKTLALAGGFSRRNEPPAVSLWDLASGDEVGRIEGLVNVDPMRRNVGGNVFAALAYSPDGRTLAALLDGRVVLVEVATGKPRGQFTFAPPAPAGPYNQGVTLGALAFSPDGKTLAAGCPDGAVRRFDLLAGRELTPLPAHTGPVLAVCCPSDGKSILSYGLDGQFYAWRTDSAHEWKPKPGPLPDAALDALWDALRSDDPLDQYGCTEALAAAPDQAVALLCKRVTPAPKEDADRIDHLIQDVHKGDYNARKKAVIELRKIGAAAVPALQRSQQMPGGYDELTQRLMVEFSNLPPSPEQQRSARAVAVLERVGGADARKLLEELAAGAPDAPLTGQAKAALGRLGEAKPPKPAPSPDALWDVLASDDGTAAYEAVRALAGRPGGADLLRDRLKDAVAKDTFDDDPKRVAKLIAALDDDDFEVRDKASKDLRNLGRLVAPSLRAALETKPSAEARSRLQDLLNAATKAAPPPEVLRVGRALEALELAGGPEARQALEAVEKDARTKWMRDATAEALRRLGEPSP
jgi:WD40 repeat protein